MNVDVKPRKQKFIFSQKLMLAFIRDYRSNVCLWDARLLEYKCSNIRKAAIARMALKYDMTEEETKRKINSLRSTYLQEKKKIEESRRDGTGEPTYEPSLYWYKELDFLSDVIIPRKAPNFSIQASATVDEQTNSVEVDEDHLIFEYVSGTSDKAYPTSLNKMKRSSSGALCSPSGRSDDFQSGDERKGQVTSTSLSNEDEIDAFCHSIALQLRTLPPQDAIELQMNIQQAVSLKRLDVLRRQQQEEIQLRKWEGGQESESQMG